jgi:hypothetical protein
MAGLAVKKFAVRCSLHFYSCTLNILCPQRRNVILEGSTECGTYRLKYTKTIILSVVLYGCEASSPTLREEHRLRVYGNRVLKRMFGPKRDGVTGEWRKIHSGELHNLHSCPSIIREVKSRKMR